MFRAITLVTFAVATLFGSVAHAQTLPAPSGKQAIINYADLDISRPAGAAVLITRMRRAAAQVCGPAPDARDLIMYRFYRNCVTDTVARGVAAVNAPVVSELYRGAADAGQLAELTR
jgi:UrcA family protein